MYAFYVQLPKETTRRHIGYVVPKTYADQVYAALYWHAGIGKISFQSSSYAVPKKWAAQWLPVWRYNGPDRGEWGRFLAPYNQIVTDSLQQYFRTWRAQNNYANVATTTNLSDAQRAAQTQKYAAQSKQNEISLCAPRKPRYNSAGEWTGCQ